jgi:hypothetical protein
MNEGHCIIHICVIFDEASRTAAESNVTVVKYWDEMPRVTQT